ncbi:hypothetical protein [Clostridium sp.]|uniref:hypothetical protein n=1 Tax=Clostridium sp. TaxID=1506 RepID=UPI0025BDEC77|nr:hypothetical protein [Clostridium sp.]
MKIISQNKIIKKQHVLLLILFIYTFFYTDIVKEIIIQNFGINVKLSPIMPILIIYCAFKYGRNLFIFWIVLIICSLVLLTGVYRGISISTLFRTFNTTLIPLVIIGIKIYNPRELINKFIKIFNYMVVIYVLIGCMDYITHGFFLKILNILLKNSYYNKAIAYDLSVGIFRWFSLFGHPLTNSLYMIIFLGLNITYRNIYKEKYYNIYIIYAIALIGSILSNSKFGIIITIIILIVNIMNEKNKIIYITSLIIGGIITINTSYFEKNVIIRFKSAILNGDITNGRMTVLSSLLNYNLYKINYFIGNGMSSSDVIVKLIFGSNSGLSNMEIPILMFLYEYGVLVTILMYLIMILYPIFILINARKIFAISIVVIIFLFINSFNGMATGTGTLQVYIFTIMLILNMQKVHSNND